MSDKLPNDVYIPSLIISIKLHKTLMKFVCGFLANFHIVLVFKNIS